MKRGNRTRCVAFCGVMAALGVALMLLGGAIGIGTYVCPMLVGVLMLPAGRRWGRRWQVLLWLAIGILSFFLVPDLEESLMFLGFFGWYPILRPSLDKLPPVLRWVVKLALFNVVVIALEALLMLVLIPQSEAIWILVLLWAAFNLVFVCYDFALPRLERIYLSRIEKLLK